MRASLASLGPGVLQGWTCETEQFLGLVSAPRRLCTTAANVSRAAWLYVRQELAQASVKPSGQPLPFTAESSACRQRPCCSPLSLKDACPVPCSSLLASLCCSATCCLLRRPLSHSTELGAAGQPPPRGPGLCFLAGTQSHSPVTRPKSLTARPPACRACSSWGTT